MAENGLNPNNAMLYAFTNKMKKMKQKKFQNFPKIQRRRTRRVGVSIFIQKIFIQKIKQFLAGELFQQIEANVRQGCDVCSFQLPAVTLAAGYIVFVFLLKKNSISFFMFVFAFCILVLIIESCIFVFLHLNDVCVVSAGNSNVGGGL